MKTFIVSLFFILASVFTSLSQEAHRIIIEGIINPVATEYIAKAIDRAEEESAELLIIQMDTPGGLMASMHDIMKSIQASEVPVAVYVAPSGSRAGSAGVFITYASHIAAMAPSTNIGSAHPVMGGGMGGGADSSEVLMEKVVNDAIAKIKTVAERRGRNAEWAEKAIRESANITETEALEMNVIEYVVPTVDSLLAVIDSTEIELDDGTKILMETRNIPVITYEMTWRQRLLDTITDPNIAYILMIIGFYGILFELYNPGSILPGVVGGISLILGFYALQTLPVNYAGLALIIFSIILFLLEIKIQSFGLLTIGGVISLVMGSVMLYDRGTMPFLRVSWEVILGVVIVTILFFGLAIGLAVRTYRTKATTGKEGMVGEVGIVFKEIEPGGEGTVRLHGEFWKAISDEKIEKDKKVKVIEYDGKSLTLKVKAIS
jgi:membrane-bound serine protease (ClpP class)